MENNEYEYPPEVEVIFNQCEAGQDMFTNDAVSTLLVEIDRLSRLNAAPSPEPEPATPRPEMPPEQVKPASDLTIEKLIAAFDEMQAAINGMLYQIQGRPADLMRLIDAMNVPKVDAKYEFTLGGIKLTEVEDKEIPRGCFRLKYAGKEDEIVRVFPSSKSAHEL